MVDQTPIGSTTRSNPASYVGAFDAIRDIYSRKSRSPSERKLHRRHLQLQLRNGRCPTCGGNGFEHVEMQFLSDVYLRCPDCNGKRFRDEVLEVTVEGKSIADVLELTVSRGARASSAPTRRCSAGSAAAGRRRPRVPAPRPAGADAVRRRGAAPEARRAPGRSERRADSANSDQAVPVRRADHRPALRRRRQAAARVPPAASPPGIRWS